MYINHDFCILCQKSCNPYKTAPSQLARVTGNDFFQLIFDLPVAISFYYRGKLWPESNAFCVWWVWLSFSCDIGALLLMVWIAIERHLLIFHSQAMFQGRWIKWIFHVPPLIICVIQAPNVYFILVVMSTPCTPVISSVHQYQVH